MGGLGSGRPRSSKNANIDGLISIDVRTIPIDILLPDIWITAQSQSRGQLMIKGNKEKISFGIGGSGHVYQIGTAAIVNSPRNFGGAQSYFTCPTSGCSHRAAILYLNHEKLACRRCTSLSYASQCETKTERILRRASTLRKRLGGKPGFINPLPTRPKGMHHSTYDNLVYIIQSLELSAIGMLYGQIEERAYQQLNYLDASLIGRKGAILIN